MARKELQADEDVMPPSAEESAAPKKTRGPRGVKLSVPAHISDKLKALAGLYGHVTVTELHERFGAKAEPQIAAALDSSLRELAAALEVERNYVRQQVLGLEPAVPQNEPLYTALDDGEAQ